MIPYIWALENSKKGPYEIPHHINITEADRMAVLNFLHDHHLFKRSGACSERACRNKSCAHPHTRTHKTQHAL